MRTRVKMCVGISGVLTDSVFVLMCVDVCLRLCLFVRNKAVVCQNFRNGDERKQHLHDILTKRRIIILLLVMAQDWTHGLRLDPPNGANPLRKFDTFTRQSDISDKSSLDDTLVSNLRLEPHPPRILASCSTFAGLLCLALVALPCAGAPSGRAWALPF